MSLSETTNDSVVILWVVICVTKIVRRPELNNFVIIGSCGQTSAMFNNIGAAYHVSKTIFKFNTRFNFGGS